MYERSLRGIAEYHTRDPIRDLRNYSSAMSLSQVVKFFEKYGVHYTNTTIQHYVRVGILPPPVNRKYTRPHIARLALAARLRSTFALDEIQALLEPIQDAETAYNTLMDLLWNDLQRVVKESEDSASETKLALAARAVVAKEAAVDL